ncbi:HBL/NHE enterotoxin family protein [Chengkuizengella sediminis]|uniref:HBL/NHE enterotoxin family protein n=1 Tax=Chengkuizengella sediminis TaxID=1885917 RepID=UPI0013894C55|nr:HBL/NHE enterotoxin family protein [Chengkuizengella sediminis]NDI33211.1 alpha-helical pore-forming toxin family protein [Chengkuizengella sediminis]
MNKHTKRVFFLVLAIILGFGTISPSFSVSAIEIPHLEEDVISLRGLSEGLREMATSFAVAEAYARTATQNTQIVFGEIQKISLKAGLVQPLETHLNDINAASRKWLDDIKPKMKQVNQDIISWTNTQTAFITPLRTALANNDQSTFIQGVHFLQVQAERFQTDIDGLLNVLISHRGTLEDIVGKLTADFNRIKIEVEGEDDQLAILRSELETLNIELKNINKQLTGLSLGTAGAIGMGILGAAVSTVFLPVGAFMMFTGITAIGTQSVTMLVLSENRDKILRKIVDKTKNLSQTKFEYGVLSHIKDDTGIILENTHLVFNASENIKSQWSTMEVKLKNLVFKLMFDWDTHKVFIPAQLNSLETEAGQLNAFAKGLQLEYEFTIDTL